MIRVRLPRILMIAALAALALVPVGASAAPKSVHFNNKFEFTNVSVTDADGTTSVTIRAGSKQTDGDNQFTVCGYSSADDIFLGQFESDQFAAEDPESILSFCSLHFADRAV